MRLKVAKNAKKGMLFGFINKAISLLLPFLVQTVMIRYLGTEYLGVKGLFTSILQVFSLAELGFGTAIVYSMYKPIADGNQECICALMSLYKKIYRYIGLIILIVGVVFIPILPMLIKGEYPSDLNLTAVYLLYLSNTVLTYWLFAYRSSLFLAYQRFDIISIIHIIISITMYGSQIAILVLFKNFYVYLIMAVLSTVLNNLLIYIISKTVFSDIEAVGNVDEEIKHEIKEKVKGLLVYKVCGVTRNAFDNIFVSMYLGLTITAMYSNYFYILTAVSGVLSIISSSLIAGVGNSIKLDSVEKNRNNLVKLDCVYTIISGWCMVYMMCLYQPFIEVWVGKELQFPFSVAVMFAVYFYLLQIGNVRALYSDAAGLWWENRYRTIGEAISNIFLNYLFVRWWGVYGIIAATMITIFFFGFVGSASVLYKYYFKQGLKQYFIQHFSLGIVNLVVCILAYYICSFVKGDVYSVLIKRFCICCIIPLTLYTIVAFTNHHLRESFKWIFGKIRSK